MSEVIEKRREKRGPGRPEVAREMHTSGCRFTINLPPNRFASLQAEAERQGLSVASYCRQSILLRLDDDLRQAG